MSLRPVVTGYLFFLHLFAETLYVIWILPVYSMIEKKVEKGEPSDLTFFGTQKVETFILTFFGSPTCL